MTETLRNEQILCIGFPAWEGDYLKSTVQLVSELAKNNQVLYVEYPFTWKDAALARLGKGKAPWRRILGKEERLRSLTLENGAKVNVLTLPPVLPVNFINNENLHDAMLQANAGKAFKAIRQAMESLGMSRPVVVNAFNPFLGVFLAKQFDEKALIYYCYDEISAATWAGKHGARLENRFLKQVDAVVTCSKPLFQAKQTQARRAFLVKNGVDFDLFHNPQSPITNHQSSIIGFLGSLDERIDFDLLETVITKLHHRKFRFVGRVNSPEAERLRGLPNVEILGSQPPASLPGLVQQFSVCMIPFLKNKLTAGIYPIKINEYFAAGKPVVATGFGDLSDFQHLVKIADTPQAFAEALETYLENDENASRNKRIAFAKGNSWQQRAAEMGEAISQVLEENRIAAFSGEADWMPDNFNRWGETSAGFFQKRKETQPAWSGSGMPAFA